MKHLDTRMLDQKMKEIEEKMQHDIKHIIWDFFQGEKYRIVVEEDFDNIAKDILTYLREVKG